MSLGSQVFQTDSKPRSVKSLTESEEIYIEPGQFALLLTEETVKIPENKLAFISIKAGIKFKGLVNVSGFHVDPGFEGKLLFSVYNAGPSTIPLRRGEKCFPIWFAELANNESQKYTGSHGGQINIPIEPITALSQGELASPNSLSKRIDDVKHLKTKIEWVVLAILTLAIGLSVKFWSDSSKLKDAIDYGYTKRIDETSKDSLNQINQAKFDSIKTELQSVKDTLEKIRKK